MANAADGRGGRERWGTVDLHCHSCFSFLDGASHPEELIERAVALGYTALALTDHNGVYGSMEFAQAAAQAGLQAITGTEVTLEDGSHLTLLAETREGYANLCRLLTLAHRESERRQPQLPYAELPAHTGGLICLSGCRQGQVPRLVDAGQLVAAEHAAARLREWFGPAGFYLELQQNLVRGDTSRNRQLAELGRRLGVPLVGTNNTHYHVRERYRLQDTLVAIRHGMSLDEAEELCRPNSEFALKSPSTLRARFRHYPAALENALEIAARCRAFDLTRDLGYSFPEFVRDASDDQFRTADEALEYLCREALEVKYRGQGAARITEAKEWLEKELGLVQHHRLAGFFLVYRDLLQMSKEVAAELRLGTARGKYDLPPGRGRGSAVSSIICYLIGLSPVDPVATKLFPGRFLNESLTSVPDIDIDFPRDVRAKLIERVHAYYGRDHVAMVNIMPTFKFRGAVREVGKALGLPPAEIDRLAKAGDGWTEVGTELDRQPAFSRYGENRLWTHLRERCAELWGMPRHLSQHVGGLIISSRPLVEIVPVENSAMEGRQLCQWDKDSCDAARFIKVDFLALGMLSAVEQCLEFIQENDKPVPDLSRLCYRDRAVYDRICRGETVGVFQIESRAQIGMIVRTRPRNMEDLAVEIAIVRPGPIVGNAVNPYVRQRELMRCDPRFKPRYDHPLLEPVLKDTLGVIIYQDQVMEVCKALAGFTDGEADQLRRAMSRKRSRQSMEQFRDLFLTGARKKGVPEEVAVRVFAQVFAFSEFGFPKSHSAAFAVLCYQSTWLLHYYPAEFVAALMSNQPMGFYPPDSLLKDAERRGVRFLSPHVNESELHCTVQGMTVRIGLAYPREVGETRAREILAERQRGGPFQSLPDFVRRTRVSDRVAESLILVGGLDGFGLNRRELLWQLGLLYGQRGKGFVHRTEAGTQPAGLQAALPLSTEQDQVALSKGSAWDRMADDYRLMGLSVETHPLKLLRPLLTPDVCSVAGLRKRPNGTTVQVAGMVTTRQRPETARGLLFLLLEDESGMVNVVVSRELYESARELFRTEPLLLVEGLLQRRAMRLDLVAARAWPLTEALPDGAKSSANQRVYEALNDWQPPRSHNFR